MLSVLGFDVQFGNRNPQCIVRWNYRELGRSDIVLQTQDPTWPHCELKVLTSREIPLERSTLDIDVWDTDMRDPTDFLGCVRLQGEALVSFLEEGGPLKARLGPSKRLADSENVFVGGIVELAGSVSVLHDGSEANTRREVDLSEPPVQSGGDGDVDPTRTVFLYLIALDRRHVESEEDSIMKIHFNEVEVYSTELTAPSTAKVPNPVHTA
jgi:hypothetical protein